MISKLSYSLKDKEASGELSISGIKKLGTGVLKLKPISILTTIFMIIFTSDRLSIITRIEAGSSVLHTMT